ncbi:sugar kinase [Bacillus timonensis]|uniref:sugar kinase n=1 Tax=Bacillus timonensis TaxID=1033734 RepID=UPI000287E948|nr:sugar kinase [Bacillus timonensis]
MDVVTIGETMVMFTPQSSPLMRYAESFIKRYGGAESNVAIGLARLGHKVGWISKVGNDEFGKGMISFIRGEGVDVSQVKTDSHAPTGLYFKEVKSGHNVTVQYYRNGSAASHLTPRDLDPDYIKQAKFLHITGITPALSDSCYQTVKRAISIAKENGVQVIFDPNVRKKLWSEEKAREVLVELTTLADIVLPGLEEGTFMFGETDYVKIGKRFLETGPKLVIMKDGKKGAYVFKEDCYELIPGFEVDEVIDPVGAGDGFAAGFISGLLSGFTVEKSVEIGNAVGAHVVQIPGDFEGLPSQWELKQFLNSGATTDVLR